MAASKAKERVGDSSKDVVGNVKRIAKILLQAATAEQRKEDKPKCLKDLISERDVLHAEWISVATDLQLGDSLSLDGLSASDESSMEAMKQEVEKLEEELRSIKLQSLQEKKLLECIHQHEYLMKHLFPEQNSEDRSEPETVVQGVVHQHTKLVSKLLYEMSELQKSKNDILALKKDRCDAEHRCRELMAKLDEGDDEDDEGDSDSERAEQMRKSKDEVTLLKHAFLQLIFGSDVDWSRDEELCELVVKLGLRS